MSTRLITGTLIAAGLLFTACGGASEPESSAASAADPQAATPAATAPTIPSATSGTSELGDILVGSGGLSLYGFTNDIEATSTCYGTCAEAWPPVIVGPEWTVAPGLDSGIFATTVRDDGQLQLVAGKWPLYFFAGDATAGDVNGQGSGDVWFVVDTAGLLVTDTTDATDASGGAAGSETEGEGASGPSSGADQPVVTVGSTELGDALVDGDGLTLYGFTNDTDGVSNCSDACAEAWPPVLVDGPDLPAGLDPAIHSVIERADGTHQLQAGIWPLYLFAGDAAPGDVNGQGSGDVWFVVAPDGTLITGEDAAPSSDAGAGADEEGERGY